MTAIEMRKKLKVKKNLALAERRRYWKGEGGRGRGRGKGGTHPADHSFSELIVLGAMRGGGSVDCPQSLLERCQLGTRLVPIRIDNVEFGECHKMINTAMRVFVVINLFTLAISYQPLF